MPTTKNTHSFSRIPSIFDVVVPDHEVRLSLLPMPFDATASYGRNAAAGPAAICRASAQVDLFDNHQKKAFATGYRLLPESALVHRLNGKARHLVDSVRRHPHAPAAERAREQVNAIGATIANLTGDEVRVLLAAGQKVGLIGGDHSNALGAIGAHAERYPRLGVLQIDAHADLRECYEGFACSHASIMRNVLEQTDVSRLVQVGIRDFCREESDFIAANPEKISTFFDDELAQERFGGVPFATQIQRIIGPLPHDVYVSFDIDGLDPSLCPHTGTPVPGGLTFQQAIALLQAVPASGRRLVGFDLTEVAPGPDGDEWDANVGARLLFQLCALMLG